VKEEGTITDLSIVNSLQVSRLVSPAVLEPQENFSEYSSVPVSIWTKQQQ
jgi:hypothetical protein